MMEEKLPKGWKLFPLKDLNQRKSKNLDPSKHPDTTFELYSVPQFEFSEPEYLKGSEIKSTKQKVAVGEVLISKINPRINRVWKVEGFSDFEKIASSEWIVIQPKSFLDSDYLRYACSASFFRTLLQSEVSGVGGSLTRARPKIVENYKIPVAPLPEQQRIVAKLDALFGHLDRLREKMNRIPVLLKNFRQQVLTQAVTGELTKEWREGKSSIKNNGPIPIPDFWSFRKLKELSSSLKYGSSSKSLNLGDVPVLRMGNIQDGEIDWSDLKYSSDQVEIEKYELTPGDLLFNRTNSPELVGKTAIFRGDRAAIYAGYLIQIKPKESINPDFLNFVLNSNYAKKWCWEVKTDGVSQSNINAKKLGDFIVPIPSLDEQVEIVAKVNVLFEISKRIESQYASLKAKIDQLPQAILAKAFRGELVEQHVKPYVVKEGESLMAAEPGGEGYERLDNTNKP